MAARTRKAVASKESGQASSAPPEPRESPSRAAGRPLWKGAISFGMVTIPVRMYAATRSKDIGFNMLHSVCGSRIRQLRWCPVCDREVKGDELVRGYQYAKDRYVPVSDEDFEKLPVPSRHVIDLTAFVQTEEIDPILYEKSYYLLPDESARKSFALLLSALEQKHRTAVALVAMRERERLCTLRPYNGTLVLETLYYYDEVSVAAAPRADELTDREVEMALMLIDLRTEKFDPEAYRDTYREALTSMLEGKVAGHEVVTPPEAPRPDVIDLAAALKASLDEARRRRTAPPVGRKREKVAA